MTQRTTKRGTGIEEVRGDGGTLEPPEPPASLPKYIHEPVAKQGLDELQALSDWIDELIEYRQRPVEIAVEDDEELVEVDDSNGSGGTQVIKKVPCGKNCDGCPHGPYEYTVYRDGDSLVWEYVGPV